VLATFVGLIVVGSVLFPPKASLFPYLVYVLTVVALLLGVCWLKGEPLRWRWGNDQR
jgi:hypothetical protein